MSKAPEHEIVDALNADAELVGVIGKLYLNEWPRGNARPPLVTVQLVGDSNAKHTLSKYGGESRLQLDLYSKSPQPAARRLLKSKLRGIRGDVGTLENVWVVVAAEVSQGTDPSGTHRETVDAIVYYEEKQDE